MKTFLLLFILAITAAGLKAQQPDSIRFNLYTDSLKKGTWNYINIEIRFSNGRYLPASSGEVLLTSNEGQVDGCSIWLPPDCNYSFINVQAKYKANKHLTVSKTLYIKQLPDTEKLKTPEELLREMERPNGKSPDSGSKRKKKRGLSGR